jgi:hypothetical protein
MARRANDSHGHHNNQGTDVRFDSLYVDADGVRRGYYVYLHRERKSGNIFYVGKGCGGRAWEQAKRHDNWIEKIASLSGQWEVVIVKYDLTELEAFDLEHKLVDRYGGAACDGGTLLNRVPGGEDPLSVAVTVALSEQGQAWQTAYEESRQFKVLDRDQQEQFVRRVSEGLNPIIASVDELRDEAEEDDAIDDSLMDIDCIVGSHLDFAKDFLRRRISWKDFLFESRNFLTT